MASATKAARWIVQEARRLGVTTLVYPECGHATRTALQYFDNWFGEELGDIRRVNILQLVDSYLREGKIRVKPGTFDVPLTYHDPCNLGRNLGAFEEPRTLINAVATDFRELTPNRELNWCCGGGGGLVADPDMFDARMEAGQPKVDQIRQTDAQWVLTACENCKTQLENLSEHYELGVEVKGVVDLIADALIL
jgi:Fe-S oxidoreductase